MERRHCMYVVECADGSWYTGYSTNVERRVAAHNAGRGAKYTRARLPVRLLASAAFATKHEAMAAEYWFKRLPRARKEELLAAALRADDCPADRCPEDCRELAAAALRADGCPADQSPEAPCTPAAAAQCASERLTNILLDEFDGRLTTMSENNVTIRLATMDDLDAVTRIEAACFPPAEAASREQFAERLAAFASHFWLLELDGEPIAMINGMVSDDPLISDEMFADASLHNEAGAWQEIFGVATLPEYQHRGYASQLMERVIADCRAQGRRGCVLTCKERLLGFYARFGYVNLGVSASEHGGAVWYDMRLEF